jgi:SAM-dependent methyltransferase
MTHSNILTDRTALTAHRARAIGASLFLQETAANEIQDRLRMVNKSFKDATVVTPFPEVWRARLPAAQLVAEDDSLDLAPGTLDLVIHSLGLHWANDPVGQLIQCRRALRPDGLLLCAVLGGRTLAELRASLSQAEIDLTGGLSPRVAPMAEIRDLGALLQRAGLALPVADSITLDVEYRDLRHLMLDLRTMGETNSLFHRQRRFALRTLFERASDLYKKHYTRPSGRICATFEIVFLTGWAPDTSQQKPLRPGSAKQRLADALAVRETPLRD